MPQGFAKHKLLYNSNMAIYHSIMSFSNLEWITFEVQNNWASITFPYLMTAIMEQSWQPNPNHWSDGISYVT